jgi:transcriptional regulator with XRE-family HTH domain
MSLTRLDATGYIPGNRVSTMDESLYAKLADRVRTRREDLKLTQADLANRAGVSRSSIANIETGRQAILLHQFIGLARALELPWEELMPTVDDPTASKSQALPKGVRAFVATLAPASRGRAKQ